MRWTSIPSRESRITSSLCMLCKPIREQLAYFSQCTAVLALLSYYVLLYLKEQCIISNVPVLISWWPVKKTPNLLNFEGLNGCLQYFTLCRFGRKKTVVVHMIAAAISAVCVSFIPAGTDNKGTV